MKIVTYQQEQKQKTLLKMRVNINKFFYNYIRTPIQGVLGLFEILEKPNSSLEELDAIQLGRDTCKLLIFLTHDITDLGQLEAEKLEIRNYSFNVKQTIDECVRLLSLNFTKKGLELYTEFTSSIKTIYSDRHRYMQILINLLGNALKFTESGYVKITASFEAETDLLITSVSDTGVGISEIDLPKLFQLFSKIKNTANLNPHGVGLGLTICKRLAESMGGYITATSKINRGSTFTFAILANTQLEKEDSLSALPEPISRSVNIIVKPMCDCPKILVVEDNSFNMMIMKKYLSLLGCNADYAGHGKEAIEKILIRSTQKCCTGYNAVLMDINMPIMNGIEATKEINNKISTGILPHTPIVALTGTELSESEQNAFLKEIGFAEYQIKPVSKIKLENLLQRYGIKQCYFCSS